MNHYITPDLCDAYPELVQVLEPMFSNFGGRDSFGGEIVTIKCFEDNSLVKEQAELKGDGKVLVVDGGGSVRRALIDAELVEIGEKFYLPTLRDLWKNKVSAKVLQANF